MNNQSTINQINTIGQDLINQLQTSKTALLSIPKRSKDNITFAIEKGILELGSKTFDRKISDFTEVKKFAQTIAILKILKAIMQQDTYLNVRGIYYCEENVQLEGSKKFLFEEQKDSDVILGDVEVLLKKFREELHITSNSKGHVVGKVRFKAYTKTRDYTIDCGNIGPEGARLPRDLSKLEIVDCGANFVLVIEKDTICYTLNYEEFWLKHNCILITAEGVPDRATRAFIKRLNSQFKLPVVVLTDNDPYGWANIFGVYKCGSINLAQDSPRLACPSAKFLGLSTSDIERYNFGSKTLEDATDEDVTKAKHMKDYPWFNEPFWQRELDLFLKIKKKSKIDALAEHGYDFLQKTYLPEKLKECGIV